MNTTDFGIILEVESFYCLPEMLELESSSCSLDLTTIMLLLDLVDSTRFRSSFALSSLLLN